MISFVSGRCARAASNKQREEGKRERERVFLSSVVEDKWRTREREREKGNEVEYPTNSDRRRTRLERDSMDLW